jgi:AraC family transcriptional regulator
MTIAGLWGQYNPKTAPEIPLLWQRFVPYLGKIPGRIGSVTYAPLFDHGDGSTDFDYLAGVEVSDASEVPAELRVMRIPAFTYAVFPHHHHVSRLKDTMSAIWRDWLPIWGHHQPGKDVPNMIEFYSEHFNPRTGTGGMEVWVPIA